MIILSTVYELEKGLRGSFKIARKRFNLIFFKKLSIIWKIIMFNLVLKFKVSEFKLPAITERVKT